MEQLDRTTLQRRRAMGGAIAGMTVGAVVLASALMPTAANALDAANPNDPSVAQGQIIQLPAPLLGGLDIAALGHTLTSNPAAPGSELGGLDVGLLEALSIDVGTLNIPLLTDGTSPGLLQLGDLGATQSFSSSPTQTTSTASSGTITSGGAIDTGAIDGSTDPATLELTDLFDQLAVAGLTDAVLDQASIGIGALASRAESNAGTTTSEYRIADLNLDLHSNLVAGLSTTLAAAIQGTVTPVSALAGPGGALTALTTTLVNTINAIPDVPLLAAFEATGGTVSIAGLDTVGQTVASEVLLQPLENTTGSVLVNLSTGTVSVDLARILVETGAGADLNSLPANTPVLSAATIAAIQQGITSALTGTHPNSLNGKVSSVLASTLDALQVTLAVGVDLTVPLTGTPLVSGDVTVNGSLAQFAGTATPAPAVTTDITLAGLDLGVLLNPVISAVTTAVATTTGPLVDTALTSVIPLVEPALAALTGPILTTLDPVLQGVLSGVATITINEQPATGDIPGDSFTVRALAIDLLPAVGGGVALDLGSSTVKAAAAAVAAIDAAATVQAGTSLAVNGSGWPATTQVSVQLTAPGGGNVGAPVTATTDALGGFTLAYPVPSSATPGAGYTVTATAGTTTATDTTEVTAAATVDAAPTVQAGTDLPVSGAGWPANTEVSVQLTAPGGGNVGTPVIATTNASGEFTADYPVPAGTPAGTGYTVTASVGTQTATDTTEVTAAPATATVDAAATVEAGTDLPVSGTNWPANTVVTVQLTAPGGGLIGTPQTATTNGLGVFAIDYPVPAGTPAGTGYTVTATAGTQTATDTTEVTAAPVVVDAAAQVPAGTNLAVTGSGWPVNSSVSLQLTAPGGGANVGGPVTATTDASGAFTANYPVPADTAPTTGYTLTATAGAVTATDTTEVTAADPADVNTNAAASASASADATADGDPSAQAAAEAAALADATSAASAAATADATAAAQAAATADASTTASTDVTSTANASAAVAAQAAAQADASDDVNAAASAAAEANSAASSEAAATTDSSTDASSEASANTNAAASASASADADASTAAVAEASAQAAAFADATAEGSAAADPAAEAAAQAAATATASTAASADATSEANAGAAIAAQAAALADATTNTAAEASATSDASTSAAANASAAAIASASTDASADAVASADASAEINTNASASAAASAQADDDSNASAEAAAVAAALADATSQASAAADLTANAAAQAAATTDASTDASSTATTAANASAAAAAQAAAQNDATSTSAADASASADADPNAAAAAAANASSSATASATAAADASATATASASADAAADPNGNIAIALRSPVLQRGAQQTAVGTGFQPGETVTGLMTSAPVPLGTQVADAQGTVTFTWTIPSSSDLGTHTVTLTGATSGSVSATFQVVASGLATTGGQAQGGAVALAVLLLMLGLGALRLARSRRPQLQTE